MNLEHVKSSITGEVFEKGSCLPLEPFQIEYRRSLADGFVYCSLYPLPLGFVCVVRAGSNDKKVIDYGVWLRCFDPGPET